VNEKGMRIIFTESSVYLLGLEACFWLQSWSLCLACVGIGTFGFAPECEGSQVSVSVLPGSCKAQRRCPGDEIVQLRLLCLRLPNIFYLLLHLFALVFFFTQASYVGRNETNDNEKQYLQSFNKHIIIIICSYTIGLFWCSAFECNIAIFRKPFKGSRMQRKDILQ